MNNIIYQPWGGLGDNLQLSTIPEVAFNYYGEKKIYISNQNVYRNPEIKKLVWDNNPFIAGYKDGQLIPNWKIGPNKGHIASIEEWFSLPPSSKFPKIYYKYEESTRNYFEDKTFIDFHTSQENANYHYKMIERAKKYVENLKKEKEVYEVVFVNQKFENLVGLNLPQYFISNIFEYCNLIKYCKKIITFFSGNAVLASAVKQNNSTPQVEVICDLNCFSNKVFVFDNINYIYE